MSRAVRNPPFHMLLVDDHAIVREGLRRVLQPIADRWSFAEAANAVEALDYLRGHDVALAIIDLSMPGMGGLDLIRRIRTDFPTVATLVLSMHGEDQYALRAFKTGANGYVTKDTASTELLTAVSKVANGGSYVSASLAERVVQRLSGAAEGPRHHELSNREMEVLQYIVRGHRLTDIAELLHLSIKTVSTHKSRIQDKLHLTNMADLIRYGIEHRLASDDSQPAPLAASSDP